MTSEEIYISLENNRTRLGLIYCIAMIQLRGGFRVSEVLKMNHTNIISDTDVFIIPDKNSRPKRIHVPELSLFLNKWKLNQLCPFQHLSRFQVYRAYKQLGIIVNNGVNKNKSVTHAMRKNYIKDAHKTTGNIKVTADIAGHKSQKSTEYYVK